MSGAWTGLTWDELDRLADYTAGVLSGAEADEVARLIRTDDRWAAAHAELLAAQPAVSAALQAAADTPVTMPADIAARLDAALADARLDEPADGGPSRSPSASPSGARPASARSSGGRPAGAGPDATRPSDTRPSDTRPPRGRAGRGRRMPLLMRVAAGVVAFVAVGGGLATWVVNGGISSGLGSALDAGEAMSDPGNESAELPEQPPAVVTDAGTRILASGTDYSIASLPDLANDGAAAAPRPPGGLDVDMSRLTVEDSLAEVATPAGLTRCLAALQSHHPGAVTIVDFARFEGVPAIVVVVRNNAATTVVALGAGCGTDGLDELASVPVR